MSDLTTADRVTIARAVWDNRTAYDGFVIAHGTDTLAATAALLDHMLPGIDRPVVLTGSMLPMGAPASDAPRNLLDAFRVAAAGRAGVFAVLCGAILPGRHVYKRHSTAIDAFCAVGAPPRARCVRMAPSTGRRRRAPRANPPFARQPPGPCRSSG